MLCALGPFQTWPDAKISQVWYTDPLRLMMLNHTEAASLNIKLFFAWVSSAISQVHYPPSSLTDSYFPQTKLLTGSILIVFTCRNLPASWNFGFTVLWGIAPENWTVEHYLESRGSYLQFGRLIAKHDFIRKHNYWNFRGQVISPIIFTLANFGSFSSDIYVESSLISSHSKQFYHISS